MTARLYSRYRIHTHTYDFRKKNLRQTNAVQLIKSSNRIWKKNQCSAFNLRFGRAQSQLPISSRFTQFTCACDSKGTKCNALLTQVLLEFLACALIKNIDAFHDFFVVIVGFLIRLFIYIW